MKFRYEFFPGKVILVKRMTFFLKYFLLVYMFNSYFNQ